MTQFLPPNLLALFAPRDPIPYLPPLEKLPHEKHHNQPYCGIAPYIREFEVSEFSVFFPQCCGFCADFVPYSDCEVSGGGGCSYFCFLA